MTTTLRRLVTALTLLAAFAPAPAFAAGPTKEQNEATQRLQQDRQALRKADARLQEARAALLDVPTSRASVSLSLAKMAFDTANLSIVMNAKPEDVLSWLRKGERYVMEASMSLIPSRGAEVRAMLIDAGSLPKTEVELIKLLDKLAAAHFNVLVPEVYRRGYTIYPSAFTDRDPDFKDAPDILKILVREAHVRGMEVQPWVWTFRARSPGFGNPLLGRLPGLGASTDGKETRFLSAANPLAREYVFGLLDELAEHYDIDGLLLDYIRYDEEIPEDDTSKTRFALEYRARHGVMPTFPVPPHSQLAVEWQLWREQQVNTAVQELSRMLRAKHPRFPIGAAIFRGEGYARLAKMQHWRHWSNNQWVDWAAPMLYTPKNEDLVKWLDWETDHHTRTNLIYPILGVHRMDERSDLVDEIVELHAKNVPGFMIFALAHFDMTLLDDLKAGPFREAAAVPHRNLIRATRRVLVQANHYLTRVFTEGDFEAAATARMLHKELVAISVQLPLHELPYWQNQPLIERIQGVQALADAAPWPDAVRKEFKHRLDYAITLVQANAFQLDHTRFVPSSLPPIQIQDAPKNGQGD
ncbi:MAG: hypothetical protein JWM80_1123 [Cyanobacteria bacterium RYN_339]|nr:hypothetical protein [Cyanobacteria bacterium RYN_339]